jgi:hypothetical protein
LKLKKLELKQLTHFIKKYKTAILGITENIIVENSGEPS